MFEMTIYTAGTAQYAQAVSLAKSSGQEAQLARERARPAELFVVQPKVNVVIQAER